MSDREKERSLLLEAARKLSTADLYAALKGAEARVLSADPYMRITDANALEMIQMALRERG